MPLITELKRRNVFKVATLYIVASWLLLQVADVLFEQLSLPGWTFRFVFGLLLIGFPLVLLFSWIFEITPEGIRRESEIDEDASITRHTGQRINKAIVTLLVLAILTVVADRLIPEKAQAPDQSADPGGDVSAPSGQTAAAANEGAATASDKSIAVLPFVNMSGDADNEYFSDGLTEELLNSLARIDDLKVAGRTSSFAFKGQNQDLREIARQLDVANLLEGSVRKAGNRVRITAQLVKASDGYHLWSDTFDRELDDIFQIQEEIAEMVADALQSTLLGTAHGPLVQAATDKPEAWEAYLRGRYLFRLAPDDEETRRRAEAEFIHALNIDPHFTLARWGLFGILDSRHRNGFIDYHQGVEAMNQLALIMVEEAPDLAESHLALGRAALSTFQITKGQQAYRRAVQISPRNVDALMALAGTESNIGNPARNRELRELALSIDPLAIPVLTGAASGYAREGRCEDTRRIYSRVEAIAPDAGRIRSILGYCLLMFEDNLTESIDLFEREPVRFLRHTMLAIAWHRRGDQEKAAAELATLQATYGDAAAFQYGQVYAQWGEPEKAVEWLTKAWDGRDPGILGLRRDLLLEPLKNDPGYRALLQRWKQHAGL
jgi:serine/threonine-protein kinase